MQNLILFTCLVVSTSLARAAAANATPARCGRVLGERSMRIATPGGKLPLETRSKNDPVWSYDVGKGEYVYNYIREIVAREVDEVLVLSDRLDLETDGERRFYDFGAKAYVPIASLDPTTLLLGYYPHVRNEHERAVPVQLARGPLVVKKGPRTIYDVRLQFPPQNYFLEGVLVAHD